MKKTKVKVAIIGANGRIGKVLKEHFSNHSKCELICSIDVEDDNKKLLDSGAQVAVVFAEKSDSVIERIKFCMLNGISVVNGTTGFTPEQNDLLRMLSQQVKGARYFAASNFALKSILATEGVAKIAKYTDVSGICITEYHRLGKLDKPSGTARSTAERIFAEKGIDYSGFKMELELEEINISDPEIPGAFMNRYTFNYGGITIVAIRSDNYVAKQKVEVFGADSYVYIHDAPERTVYMQGVELAIDYVLGQYAAVYTNGLLSIL